jgi:hypothetical protein
LFLVEQYTILAAIGGVKRIHCYGTQAGATVECMVLNGSETPLGMAILAKLEEFRNASAPMVVTGNPLIELGTVTSPREPV